MEGCTLTVAELIAKLKEYPEDATIRIVAETYETYCSGNANYIDYSELFKTVEIGSYS